MIRAEALFLGEAPLPVLSMDLRSRVLAAAAAAQRRRTQARRALVGAAAVFSSLAFLLGSCPHLPIVRQFAGVDTAPGASPPNETSPAAMPAAPFCRREMFIAAMSDDWRVVEAEFKAREEFTRRVHPM